MPDGFQPDLFAPIAAVADKPPALLLPSPSWQWDLLLTRLPAEARLVIHVSTLWTRVVIEQLVDRVMGRCMLWHTGNITEYPAPAGALPYRVIYLTDDAAASLHQRLPLIQIERDETYARFRPAEAGEPYPETLDVPTNTIKG